MRGEGETEAYSSVTGLAPYDEAELLTQAQAHGAPGALRRTRLPYQTAVGQAPGGITLLRAPIGFGKTILLRQWQTEARARRLHTNWLKLTPLDRSIEGLASSVTAVSLAMRSSDRALSPSQVIEQALAGSAATNSAFFIDQWDAIIGSESERLISEIVTSGALKANLFIATRRTCGLPLDTLLADDKLRLIGANVLKFSDSEQRRLLGPALLHHMSTELVHACDGWPLALKLLRCVEQGHNADLAPPSVFARESGFDAIVSARLAEACTEDETELLGLLGLNPDFDVALLNEVRQAGDSGALLDGIASLLPFEVHEGDRGLRYRPSELIRPILQRHFDALGPDRQRLVADRAFDKAIGQGRTLDAINFALLSGDAAKAVDMLEAIGPMRLMMVYGVEAIQDILRRVPLPLLTNSLRSKLAMPVIYAKRGCLAEAREMVDAAITDIKASSLGREPKHLALRDAIFVKMQISACCDSSWADEYERAARAELAKEPAFAAWSRVCAGIVNHQTGHLDAAQSDFEQGRLFCEQVGADYQLLHIKLHRAHIDLARGNIRIAARDLRGIKGCTRASYPWDVGVLAIAEIAKIEASLAASRTSVQTEAITGALASLRQGDGWYEPFASAFVSQARCLWRDEGIGATLRGLDDAMTEMRRRGITHVVTFLEALKAFYLALDGQIPAADALLRTSSDEEGGRPAFWRERHLRALTMSMVAASCGDHAGAAAIAGQLIDGCRQDGRKLALIEAYLGQAHISVPVADHKIAGLSALRQGLELASELGASGSLYEWRDLIEDNATAMTNMLQPATAEMLARVRAEWAGKVRGDLLSEKEISVLRGVATGATNKQLSRDLSVSVDTIKFHLKQCSRKLNARNRADAVDKARTAALI